MKFACPETAVAAPGPAKAPALYFIFLLCVLLFAGCENNKVESQQLLLQGQTMGTSYTVKINETVVLPLADSVKLEVENILADVNASMSTYLPDSELSEINRSDANEWIPISPQLYEVLHASLRISKQTGGRFDITVGPLVNLWGFGPADDAPEIPADDEIQRILEFTGMDKIKLRESPAAVWKNDKKVYIDLSAIAKGYAVDKLGKYLLARGFNNFLVEIGGEILARGHNETNQHWMIGIERPSRHDRKVQRAIELVDIAMATSGDYRNYREINGKYYSHSIDPHSGWPVQHKLASVTVLHPSATDADALATGFLVMGKKKAMEIALQEQLPVLFIERDGDEFIESYTTAMSRYLQ